MLYICYAFLCFFILVTRSTPQIGLQHNSCDDDIDEVALIQKRMTVHAEHPPPIQFQSIEDMQTTSGAANLAEYGMQVADGKPGAIDQAITNLDAKPNLLDSSSPRVAQQAVSGQYADKEKAATCQPQQN